jgi:protein phosphatase
VRPQRRPPDEGSAAERAAALTAGPELDGDDGAEAPRRGRAFVRLAGAAVVAVVLAGGAFAAWHWVRQQYFVGVYGQQVAVFRGLPQDLGPLNLATLDHTTDVLVDTLPPADQDSVRAGLVVDNSAEAAAKVEALREAACGGGSVVASGTSGSGSPTGSPAVSPTGMPIQSPGASPTRALPAQSSPGVTAGSGGASPSLPGQPSPSSSAAATCGGAP